MSDDAHPKHGHLKTIGLSALVAAGSAFGTIEAVIGPRIRDTVREERRVQLLEMNAGIDTAVADLNKSIETNFKFVHDDLTLRMSANRSSLDTRIADNRASIQTSLATHDHNGRYVLRADFIPVFENHLTDDHVSVGDLVAIGSRIDRLLERVKRLEGYAHEHSGK